MAARLFIALLAALALVGGGYWWGHAATDNAWQARQAKTDEKASVDLAKANDRANQAAANYLTEHLNQEDRYADLEARYRDLRGRVPLVVPRPVAVAAACERGSTGAAPPQGVSDAPGPAVDDSSSLTLAAVRMWNGALAGTDAPAGACGLAGAAEGADAACAEDSGLTLDDAWANHAVNAKSCAADRQRYRALIEFLNNRENL